MARRRTLRPEEKDLWRSVARSARPLHQQPLLLKSAEPLAATFLPTPKPLPALLAPFALGEKARKPATAGPPIVSLQMDAKTHRIMTKGKLAPEARLDLHGLTLAEAHPELIRFILNAQSAGMRLVLVITGKGKRGLDIGPIPQRMGALRHQLPHWLRLAPLGPAVLELHEAHLKHGGSGAFYVYLRRR